MRSLHRTPTSPMDMVRLLCSSSIRRPLKARLRSRLSSRPTSSRCSRHPFCRSPRILLLSREFQKLRRGQSLPLRNRKRIPKISRKNKCGIFPVFTPERPLQVYLSRQGPFMLWRVRQKKTGWRCQPVLVFFVNKAQTMVRTRIIASRFSNAETASAVTSPETSRMV